MKYCKRCLYPENARPTIIFNDDGICSGCKTHESKSANIDWEERQKHFKEILKEYRDMAIKNGNLYDCIIPVSGGKDSHYQVYLAKVVYGMNPLLVTYNHAYNTEIGIRNINNLVKTFGCDIVRWTTPITTAHKISRHMLKKVGDLTWHYHTGIFTFPFQVAVKWNIPLILWGEHGFAEMTGMFRLEDLPEFTAWSRQEYEMRGYKIDDLVSDPTSEITMQEIGPLIFPSDEDMDRVGVRGLYMGVYHEWEHLKITKFLVENYNFKMLNKRRERTFSLFHKIDDHANDVHDYLKFLKFGYGRGTDHASWEIRQGRMTREEGISLAAEYDHVRPRSLDIYLKNLKMTEDELLKIIEPMRDKTIWEKKEDGSLQLKDSVKMHINDEGKEAARIKLVADEELTFGKNNLEYFYGPDFKKRNYNDEFCSSKNTNSPIIL